jgi:hypothetical protein
MEKRRNIRGIKPLILEERGGREKINKALLF